MNKPTVTPEQIEHLIASAEIDAYTLFEKCTVVTVQLENGFVLTESSACVDPVNYDFELGKDICLGRIKNKLWLLEGYLLQANTYHLEKEGLIEKNPAKNVTKLPPPKLPDYIKKTEPEEGERCYGDPYECGCSCDEE